MLKEMGGVCHSERKGGVMCIPREVWIYSHETECWEGHPKIISYNFSRRLDLHASTFVTDKGFYTLQ